MQLWWPWLVGAVAVVCAVICYSLASEKGHQVSRWTAVGLLLGPLGVLWVGSLPDLVLEEATARAHWRQSLSRYIETGNVVHLAAAAAQMPRATRTLFIADLTSEDVRAQVLRILEERAAVSPMSVAD